MSTPQRIVSIIDDDVSVRRALRRLLESAGYTVETFASAVEFLDAVPLGRTACLVLDVDLDGTSGFELQDRLTAEHVRLPVVFMSARDDDATRARARHSGIVAYLRKPFDRRDLLDAVRQAFRPAP